MRWFWFALHLGLSVAFAQAEEKSILNVSYDVSREFYEQYNPLFVAHWKSQRGEVVKINQSHGGSSKQARAVIDGLEGSVVTMNQPTDVDAIVEKGRGLIPADWRGKFHNNASPYTSVMAFMVRKGNPKRIKDWDDLTKQAVGVVLPNPKTAGNGRYSYLSAWAYALSKNENDASKAKSFVSQLLTNVLVLDSGGRGATTTFVQRGIGDVLVTFEAEVLTLVSENLKGEFELVVPSQSVEAEMPVAVIEKVVNRRGTREIAHEYLQFLYSDEAQELVAKFGYRPSLATVAAKHKTQFRDLKVIKVEEAFGSWAKAMKEHFSDGGSFDQIYAK